MDIIIDMSKFLEFLYTKTRTYTNIFVFLVVFIIFLVITIYTFNHFKNTTLYNPKTPFEDTANHGLRQYEMDVRFFYANWCPYCKKAMPEWQSFCDEYNGKNINGNIVLCDRNGTNCTNEDDPNVADILKEYHIKSFPTVIIFKRDKRYDFDARVTKTNLDDFVKSVSSTP